jgi:hypothetical protein
MSHRLTFFLLALSLSLTSCLDRTQVKFVNRMEGNWELTQEEQIWIKPDGTTELLSEGTNLGTLTLTNPTDSDLFLYYDLQIPGVFSRARDGFKTGEEGKRVFFYYFYCDELFGCDLVCTIKENTENRQVWQFVRPYSSGGHRRITWTFER